ncbi:DUF7504 family protein [Haloarchaeobius sp. TZWWS8]|uniref:DUF7504 family protein n=1 Tax=Haloarchaeobius sp. TZWWS8 TaxID=3446121 RepID=UPI003EBD5DD9
MDAERIAFERQLSGAAFRDAAAEDDFASVLATYKRRGCAMIVTGAVAQETAERAFRLLGGAVDVDRKRIVVMGDDDDPGAFLPEAVEPGSPDVRVFSAADYVSLEGLREAVLEATVRFDSRTDRLEPGQLRLLVPDVDAVLSSANADSDESERFVRALGTIVRGVRGMGYVHRRQYDVEASFIGLFDGWIELREGSVGPQHRWHVPPGERTTDWIRL